MAYLVTIFQGVRFHVAAFADDRGRCRLKDFYDDPKLVTQKDIRYLSREMQRMAERGPSSNPERMKPLSDGLFEFKAPDGARVIWFYDDGKVVVASHGFVKKKMKTPPGELNQAQEIRKQYLEAKHHGNLHQLRSFEELEER